MKIIKDNVLSVYCEVFYQKHLICEIYMPTDPDIDECIQRMYFPYMDLETIRDYESMEQVKQDVDDWINESLEGHIEYLEECRKQIVED